MRILLFCCILLFKLNATITSQMYELYQKGEYLASCNLGLQNLKYLENNEAYLSLYAFSCLKADQLDRLNTPLMELKKTKESRSNASYFALLVLQKKLLIQSLYDNYTIKTLKLPSSSHLLSKIFTFYQNDPQNQNTIKEYIDQTNSRISYKLYKIESDGKKTIAIDEYYDKILTLHHIY